MSFLGVGAPEALLVGVVALVVFGPKGLADAARSLGQAVRTFQPTIKEVVQVSQELKGTLEKELGINELRDATRPTPTSSLPQVADDVAKTLDPEIEAKRAAAAKMAWGEGAAGAAAASSAAAVTAEAAKAEPATPAPPGPAAPPKSLDGLSIEELEAELQRRKTASGGADAPKQ